MRVRRECNPVSHIVIPVLTSKTDHKKVFSK